MGVRPMADPTQSLVKVLSLATVLMTAAGTVSLSVSMLCCMHAVREVLLLHSLNLERMPVH